MPPLIVAFNTEDVGSLVSYTGGFAGVGIQYVVPAMLCYCGRNAAREVLPIEDNPHASWFRHRYWIYGVCGWSLVSVVLVAFNLIYSNS